jgi:hypothetical protein
MISVTLVFFVTTLLTIAVSSSVSSSVIPRQGLSDRAVPSLVMLGTAKGGTTDIWHMIHRIHKGFCSYDPRTTEKFDRQFVEHIQTKKELDFFSAGLDSVCSGSDSDSGDVSGSGSHRRNICSPSDMGALLRCPNVLLNRWIEERKRAVDKVNVLASRCREWLAVHQISKSMPMCAGL